MTPDLAKTAEDAVTALRALTRAALLESGCPPTVAEDVVLEVRWHDRMEARELLEEVLALAEERVSESNVFQHGRVYCYACGCSTCDHAQPSAAGDVFAGYESTGRPRWEPLFGLLLALDDKRTNLLFGDHPQVLARTLWRPQLTRDQLASFGRNSLTYRVWGQVVAGYLPLDGERAALTVQLVETAEHALHLQLIAPDGLREALAEADPDHRSAFHRVHEAIGDARHRIQSLSIRWRSADDGNTRNEVRERTSAVLRHLSHSIERKGRQHRRRTSHAEVRAQQQRPVHKADDDLKQASPEDFLHDTVRNSIIVLGRNGRMHVFSHQAKHITSLLLSRDELEKRQRRKRYTPLEREEALALRQRLLDAGNDED